MQSKHINLTIKPSKFPIIALLVVFVCSALVGHLAPYLSSIIFVLFAVICLTWLYRYLNFKPYNLQIFTPTATLQVNNSHAHLIKARHICWWLSIIHISMAGKRLKVYLFADSVPFKLYKSFRVFSQWT